jgi:hypothetical protein
MNRSRPPISPEVRALLDRERAIPPQPASVRARAMARARAALAMRDVALASAPVARPRISWTAVVAGVCVVSAALGAAAYAIHARRAPAPALHPAASVPPLALPPSRPPVAAPLPAEAPPATERALRAAHPSQADAIRAELRLLRQARAAVGREDFAAALVPIAEHARRFKDGRLAEEREALRVKALAGLGRTEEARRAAASFEAHFPHSVLLPAVSKMPASVP